MPTTGVRHTPRRYTTLSLAEVIAEVDDIADVAVASFGGLDTRRLNWKPDEQRWSVAQCLEHLLTGNVLLIRSARDALTNPPHSVWQRMPLLPVVFGQMLIRSQAPNTRGKFKAPAKAQPSRSEIPADIVDRFVAQHRDAATWIRTVDEHKAATAIMVSPFVRVVTYSVLDAFRLLVAHDRRHLLQARRVLSL